jgi:hypothetical protein
VTNRRAASASPQPTLLPSNTCCPSWRSCCRTTRMCRWSCPSTTA